MGRLGAGGFRLFSQLLLNNAFITLHNESNKKTFCYIRVEHKRWCVAVGCRLFSATKRINFMHRTNPAMPPFVRATYAGRHV